MGVRAMNDREELAGFLSGVAEDVSAHRDPSITPSKKGLKFGAALVIAASAALSLPQIASAQDSGSLAHPARSAGAVLDSVSNLGWAAKSMAWAVSAVQSAKKSGDILGVVTSAASAAHALDNVQNSASHSAGTVGRVIGRDEAQQQDQQTSAAPAFRPFLSAHEAEMAHSTHSDASNSVGTQTVGRVISREEYQREHPGNGPQP